MVLQAVKDLGYRPSRVARSLRSRRNKVWALIISDICTGPFSGAIVRGVEDVAYEAGYSLFLCNTDEDHLKEASYIELAVAENVGGVILTPSGPSTDLSPLLDFGIPVVLARPDPSLTTTTGYQRHVGYCKALEEAGVALDESLVCGRL